MKLKRIILLLLTVMFSFSYGEVFAKDGNSLKKALKNKFLIGVSVNTHQSSGKDVAAVEIVKKNTALSVISIGTRWVFTPISSAIC